MNKFEKGIKLIEILNSNSFEAYIVGGAVRDYLLNLPLNDIDITTNATIEDVCRLFDNVIMEGSKYLSCRVIYLEEEFEVTMFRKDIEYLDHRHPVTVKASTIEEDLVRRDFTINAFAMNSKYEIIDLFEGKKDLVAKVIKTIGKANIRFDEDALRVLRALYFSSKLDFILDDEIIESFKENHLRHIKEEYVKDMLSKIISFNSNKGLEYIVKYNILRSFPYYEELAELAYKYNLKADLFALYKVLNKDLPNVLITKKEKNRANIISSLVLEKFSNDILFTNGDSYLEEALVIYNALYEEKLCLNDILNKLENLSIRSVKEIKFDFKLIEDKERSKTINKVVGAILNGNINNDFNEIKNYLGVV